MSGITVHFLLVYSYEQQKLLKCESFTESKKATAAYAEIEREYKDRSDEFEIVLVGADSIETIRKTHGHYFVQATDVMFEDFLVAVN